jgi:hypothetical protein
MARVPGGRARAMDPTIEGSGAQALGDGHPIRVPSAIVASRTSYDAGGLARRYAPFVVCVRMSQKCRRTLGGNKTRDRSFDKGQFRSAEEKWAHELTAPESCSCMR